MHALWQITRTRAAAEWRSWLSALGVFVLAAVFVLTKVTERLLGLRRWHAFGNREIVLLLVQAAAVAIVVWYVRRRIQRRLDEAERRRHQVEVLMAENEAVVRVAQVVAREFAQPLSGVLSYSELLLMESAQRSADERYQVEGLREGVLQLNHLLQTLRSAVDNVPTDERTRHVADDVERSVTKPRSRPRVSAPMR
jgi:signal transduction histidine kinase